MVRFRLTPAALASLASIGRYTEATWGRRQRNAYLRAIDASLHKLAKAPALGRARAELGEGLRSFHQGKHVIFYLRRRRDVVIVDILHERMDPAIHLPGKLP
jgi:toxin ParE1/3/4